MLYVIYVIHDIYGIYDINGTMTYTIWHYTHMELWVSKEPLGPKEGKLQIGANIVRAHTPCAISVIYAIYVLYDVYNI